MTYSVDLRERVVAFVNSGGSKGKAANLFKVSRWCVYNWLKCKDLNAKKNGPKAPWKLDSEALKAHVEKYPDAYQHERAAALGVSRHVVLHGLGRLGITRKKNHTIRREKLRESQIVFGSVGTDS
jgi:transposase